jgi:hypothetical protein
MRAERSDTTLRQATVPDRLGVGVCVDRFPGASFTASYARTRWTNMNGLGASSLLISDAPEFGAGAEVVGPHVGPSQLLLRFGGRHRTLPFGLDGSQVRETAFAGGFSAPFTAGRAVLDVTAQHATRSLSPALATSASEHAWTLSVGLTVRP